MSFISKPIILPGTASQRYRRLAPKCPVVTTPQPSETGCDYVKTYIKKEEELYQSKQESMQVSTDEHGPLSEVDTLSNLTSLMNPSFEDKTEIYTKFPLKRRKHDRNLPIFEQRDKILNRIDTHKVVIIKGATGCGKTTQVPQFILNAARERNQNCNIVVTQPRRIAAISVAKRVAEEMGVCVGSLVGYQVGLKKEACEDTRILYCTTGILLQKFVSQKHMKEFTHVVLDEIHERDQDMDFLLLVVRKLLNINSKNVKVVLMSATIETRIFSNYFYTVVNNEKYNAVVLEIPENSKYNLMKTFLDDYKNRIPDVQGIMLDVHKPEIGKKTYLTAVRLIQYFDIIDEHENGRKNRPPNAKGSVLVFLPGLHEIEEMESYLRKKQEDKFNNRIKTYSWKVIPLHSTITHDEQQSVFRPVETGFRKIILSTNIAESSITVEDIDYVIDFCLTKIMVTDPVTNYCHLRMEWASKNSLEQRAGRTGRVSDGRVFRLITEEFYNEHLEQESVPEMLRSPLDQLVLQAKLLDMGEPRAIFAIALSQPYSENIEQTIKSLKEVGALLITVNNEFSKYDGDLTAMGRVIARLPMDVRLGKLIFFGYLFNVLDECIVMACAMSVKNLFSQPFREYLKAYNAKLTWADSTCSDCIAFYNVYTLWRKRHVEGFFKKKENEFKWAKDRFVELKTLREIAHLQSDVEKRLKFLGINRHRNGENRLKTPMKALFIKLVLAAAFYPNYFFRGSQGGQVDEKEAATTLGGNDPFSTVYLQGWPPNQPNVLYKRWIQQKFSECSNRVNVSVDNSSKIYVNFGRSSENPFENKYHMEIPGKVALAVYRAVKMRQQPDFKFRLQVLNPMDANKRYAEFLNHCEQYKQLRIKAITRYKFLPWPWRKDIEMSSFLQEILEIFICYVESPHHFWCQFKSDDTEKLLSSIMEELNEESSLDVIEDLNSLTVGHICAALFHDGETEKFYRCRILSANHDKTFDIYFIDYGSSRNRVHVEELREFSSDAQASGIHLIPDLAIECSLAKIQPRRFDTENGKWSNNALTMMNSLLHHCRIAKIYSCVNNIVRVKIFSQNHPSRKTLNNQFVELGLAEKCEENYLSVLDHVERKKLLRRVHNGTVIVSKDESRRKDLLSVDTSNLETGLEPHFSECSQEVTLRGPFSPLEMRVYPATQCSIGKMVRIESTSVNAVLLDTNPSDSYERMVVASFVSTNETGDKLTLRNTTIMPNIPGLPALVCLIFAPMVELRCNSTCTKFSGALCGLGYDRVNSNPLFSDHDIELVFDVEITLDDIVKINKIRYYLNKAVCGFDGAMDNDSRNMAMTREKLMSGLQGLFEQQFELQELNFCVNSRQWGLIPENKLLKPCSSDVLTTPNPLDDFSVVYRLIWGIELNGDPTTEIGNVAKNMRQLRDFALGHLSVKDIECILCRVTMTNAINARLHLKSKQHRIRQKRFNIPEEPITESCLNMTEYR